ncbi:hypothetical protein HDG38_003161 [Paraburkholderia sp. WSM4177]|uniref:hypothetical protein n=1 Tax=Paraburkholderia sp. WSM4180 TaxID=2723099 RepID=UPI001617EE21|nr:hypothetical protein [Paraburkholderia sp. WSM4180]MBB5444532.1 hypothetical protein [Paraburkholderia sp. WSM4177]
MQIDAHSAFIHPATINKSTIMRIRPINVAQMETIGGSFKYKGLHRLSVFGDTLFFHFYPAEPLSYSAFRNNEQSSAWRNG